MRDRLQFSCIPCHGDDSVRFQKIDLFGGCSVSIHIDAEAHALRTAVQLMPTPQGGTGKVQSFSFNKWTYRMLHRAR